MADQAPNREPQPDHAAEPRGLGAHSRGLTSECAHEQGWGLHEEERTRLPDAPQPTDGGTDYEYGARDFGDVAVDTSAIHPSAQAVEALLGDDTDAQQIEVTKED